MNGVACYIPFLLSGCCLSLSIVSVFFVPWYSLIRLVCNYIPLSIRKSETLKMPAMVDSKLVKADESQKASGATGSEKQSQSGVPVPVNAMNRPPSTTTVTSTASNGAQRTTTSRRGGRTRSRSPPAMGNRLAGPSEPMPPSSLGDNPSSAAAAAAAAAKAFSSSGGGRNPNTWSEAGPREDPAFHAHAHAGYDKPYSSSSNWPGEEGPGAHAYGASHRYQGGAYGEEYRQESGGQYRRPEEAPPGYHDRRYREAPRGHAYEGERGPRPPPPPQHAGGHYPTDFRYTQGRDTRSPPKGQRSGGGTTLVIGTSKPIHVPKTPSGPPERKSRGGSTLSSVFRGRPGDDTGRAAPQDDDVDSPQKILLSLRTPTTSFEEKADKGKKGSGPPLSPDDPPQIQNSHPADQLFEVRKSEWNSCRAMEMNDCFLTSNLLLFYSHSEVQTFSRMLALLRWLPRSTCSTNPSTALAMRSISMSIRRCRTTRLEWSEPGALRTTEQHSCCRELRRRVVTLHSRC